jgi:hypothetical protein
MTIYTGPLVSHSSVYKIPTHTSVHLKNPSVTMRFRAFNTSKGFEELENLLASKKNEKFGNLINKQLQENFAKKCQLLDQKEIPRLKLRTPLVVLSSFTLLKFASEVLEPVTAGPITAAKISVLFGGFFWLIYDFTKTTSERKKYIAEVEEIRQIIVEISKKEISMIENQCNLSKEDEEHCTYLKKMISDNDKPINAGFSFFH